MVLFFYNMALLIALVASSPWWLWKMATTQKYRHGLGERLGRVRARLRSGATTDNRPVIWLHAVSVGEVLAISHLVAELMLNYPEYRLLISTTTRTGQDLARKRFGADRVFYCPLDLPWAVRAYLNELRPRLLILAETEFWPNLLAGCFHRRIPVAVVNARISDRSWPRYRKLRWLWAGLLVQLGRVMAQSETDAQRLRDLGCDRWRVKVAGNLKFDVRAASETEATIILKVARKKLRFVVAGSTLEGEEEALFQAWSTVLAADTNLALVIAPRHPERFEAVANLLKRSKFIWTRRSNWSIGRMEELSPGLIILLDSLGELASVYSLATVAFVGGSLVSAGGHNPLEPAQFAVPIVMGPHYENFREITNLLIDREAVRITEKENLAATLNFLLRDHSVAEMMGVRALEVFEQQSGATLRCINAIRELLVSGVGGDWKR